MGPGHHQVSEQLKPRDNQRQPKEKTESVDTILSIALTPLHAITILVEVWNRANYKESYHDEPRGKNNEIINTEQKHLETETGNQQMSVREGRN
jgi:hypothetical protein